MITDGSLKRKVCCIGGPSDGQIITISTNKNTPLPASLSLTKTTWKKAHIYNLTYDAKKKKYYYTYIKTEKT